MSTRFWDGAGLLYRRRESLYSARPDQALTGRTLMGQIAKNQRLRRCLVPYPRACRILHAFDLRNRECHKLGIPAKTATTRYPTGLSSLFEETNLPRPQSSSYFALSKGGDFNFLSSSREISFTSRLGGNNWSLGTQRCAYIGWAQSGLHCFAFDNVEYCLLYVLIFREKHKAGTVAAFSGTAIPCSRINS